MKFKTLLLVIFCCFLPLVNSASENSDEWYPFSFPEKLDPNSPANIGKLVLDPPAGKHGFCKVKDGHFYFEDGTRAKFWGTNLCFSACFPTHEQAEMLADRLAFFGFNAVRLHHMDFYFEPKGIFKDVYPAYKDPQMKKTGVLSEKQLERLDYLIYQLKLRGIYVDMNLLVSRHFTLADGVVDADKLGMAAKPVSMFDPKLIELQKQYAKDLLTHYNPYTKLRYCDDPVIALVEVTNENSLFKLYKKNLPTYYQKQIDSKWKNWLKGKYASTQEAKDNFYINLEKKYFEEMTNFLKSELKIKVPITGIGGYSYPQNLISQNSCDFIDKHAYWDSPQFPRKQWDGDDFRIHNKSMLNDNGLGIIGVIKQAAVQDKPYTVSEWNHCYPNEFAYETPLLIASEALKNDWDGLFQFAFGNPLKASRGLHSYFDIYTNPQQLILHSIGSLIFLGSKNINSSIQDGILTIRNSKVDGFVGFIKGKKLKIINLDINASQNGIVMLIKTSNNKFLLVAVSEIKNTNSGWNKQGGFDWGNSPVLLKSIPLEILTKAQDKLKIYEIDNHGIKTKELPINRNDGYCVFFTSESKSPLFEIGYTN